MVKIVRVRFPPLWQNIGTVLLLITNDRRVITRLLHQTKQGILLLARKSRNFNTHAHLNTTVMMHFQSRFQYTSTGRMDKLRAPDKVYPCGRYKYTGIWIESTSLQFYLERVFKCACVIKYLLFLASRRIPCFVRCKSLATTHRSFVISNKTVPIFCHGGGKRTLTIFTTYDDRYNTNTQKQWFLWFKKASAVFLARSTIRAYEGEPNNLEVGFKL